MATVERDGAMRAPLTTLDRGGYRIAYDWSGPVDGAPLLLLAGLGLDSRSMRGLARGLQDRYRCLLLDHRGTGESTTSATPYAIDDLADDVAAVLDAEGLASVSALGWSMGGTVLQALLHRHPSRVSAAVLVSTFPNYSRLQHAWLDSNRALRASGLSAAEQALAGLSWLYGPRILADHAAAWALAERMGAGRGVSDAVFEQQAAALHAFDALPSLPRVTARTLVLVGAEDVLTPLAQAEQIAAAIPSARLEVLPRGGHSMPFEYPRDTVEAARRFLDA